MRLDILRDRLWRATERETVRNIVTVYCRENALSSRARLYIRIIFFADDELVSKQQLVTEKFPGAQSETRDDVCHQHSSCYSYVKYSSYADRVVHGMCCAKYGLVVVFCGRVSPHLREAEGSQGR